MASRSSRTSRRDCGEVRRGEAPQRQRAMPVGALQATIFRCWEYENNDSSLEEEWSE